MKASRSIKRGKEEDKIMNMGWKRERQKMGVDEKGIGGLGKCRDNKPMLKLNLWQARGHYFT